MRPRSPKRWTRPRSLAHREAHCGVPYGNVSKIFGQILKRLYSSEATPPQPEMTLPAWARTARKFGWLTQREIGAVKLVPTGRTIPARPGLTELLFAKSPLFEMIPKTKNWGER